MKGFLPFRPSFLTFLFVATFSCANAQTGVSINSTGTAPNANAILDVSSTTKGALLPRMTTAQRTAFGPTGISGMTVFDTSTQTYWYWDGVANVWKEIPNTGSIVHHTLDGAYDQGGAGAGRTITADAGSVAINVGGATTIGLTTTGNIQLSSASSWVGVAAANERVEFDAINDEVNILGARVGVGTSAPDAQSLMDFSSSTQGILFPRLTTGQRGSIGQGSASDYGLWIYNTTTGRYNYWDGTAWQDVATISGIATSFIQNQYTSAQTVGQYWVSGNGRMDGGLTVGAGATLDNNNTNVGTVASGALAFGNASGEGIGSKRSAGGNQNGLDFYTASTNRLAITNAGNVGIGTTTPGHRLSVGEATADAQSVTIRGYSNSPASWKGGGAFGFSNAAVIMGQLNNVAQIGGHSATLNAWADLAINSGGGNVGIGTTTPYAKLNVGDPNGPTVYLTREDVVTTSGEVLGSLLFDSTDDTSPSNSDASVVIRATASQDHGNSNKGGYLTFLTKDNWGNGTAALERLRIQANGNVGIGSTAPAFKLHLGVGSGDGLMIGNHNDQLGWNGAGIGPDLSIRFAGYRDVVNNFAGAKIAGIRTNLCCSGLSQGMELAFYTQEGTATGAGDGNLTERLRIGNGGNVGVGTAVPVQKLHVVGTIRSTALAVASNRIIQANASGDLSASALDPSNIMTSTNISGTTNVIPKFTGTNSIGNSLTTDDGTSVTTSGQFDVTGGTGTVYTTAPIEVRTTSTPRVSFHWPGVVASQIGMDAGGVIRTFNNPGTGYEQFAASNITANGFFNTTTGYRISNAAVAGNYLRGDGTNFVSSAIQAGDIPTGSGNYIQNQIAVDQTANSRISGSSSANVYYVNHGSGNVIEVGDDSWIADVNLGNTTGIYGQQNTNHGGIRLGSNGGAVLYSDGSDGIGLGTTAPASKLHVMGKTNIHQSGAGGGQNRFEGILAPTDANGRAQLVLSSSYSDLVIASSQANDNHGSTLTFATYNPGNSADYRKFVINQGNWGARRGFLDFGFSDAGGRTNPHTNINGTDNVLSMDGFNKRLGVATMTPTQTLDVNGKARIRRGVNTMGGNANEGQLEIANTGSGDAYISFHREGVYGAQFGLEADNWFTTRGWSAGAGGYTSLRAGSVAVNGNLTVTGTFPGDNLGNHVATTTLNLQGNAVTGSAGGVLDGGGGWHRTYGQTGWFNGTYSSGMYATTTGEVATYNGAYLRVTGGSNGSGNLRFDAANPYITASSYFVSPGGAYFNSQTVYAEADMKLRGGLSNDGGNFGGDLQVNDNLRITGVVPCIQGNCPPNSAIRLTPNLHLNSNAGNAVILNWDNGTTGGTQTLRIGNGAGSDVYYCTAQGFTYGNRRYSMSGQVVYLESSVGLMAQAAACDFGATGVTLENGNSEGGGFHADGDQANIWSPGDGDRLLRVHDEDLMGTEAASERWYLNGSGTAFTVSDVYKKQNIRKVTNALSKITSITGYNYEFKKLDVEIEKGDAPRETAGVIAQEVERVMPELVDVNEEGGRFMNYAGLAPYFIEAIKEQQKEIEELRSNISDFGSANVSSKELWIDFKPSFVNSIDDKQIPVVTVTANQPGINYYVAEKNSTGFKLVVYSDLPLGLRIDYIAMAQGKKSSANLDGLSDVDWNAVSASKEYSVKQTKALVEAATTIDNKASAEKVNEAIRSSEQNIVKTGMSPEAPRPEDYPVLEVKPGKFGSQPAMPGDKKD